MLSIYTVSEESSDEEPPGLIGGSESDSDIEDEYEEYYSSEEVNEVQLLPLEPEEPDDPEYFTDSVDNTKEKYKAPVAGREAVATPPRFNITELRPWETMFCDEKEYDTVQRGGITASFVLIDVKSDA